MGLIKITELLLDKQNAISNFSSENDNNDEDGDNEWVDVITSKTFLPLPRTGENPIAGVKSHSIPKQTSCLMCLT